MIKERLIQLILFLILLAILIYTEVDGDDITYTIVTNDCISSCSVYCYVPEEFAIYIPKDEYGECDVIGNVEVEITASEITPINYSIEIK